MVYELCNNLLPLLQAFINQVLIERFPFPRARTREQSLVDPVRLCESFHKRYQIHNRVDNLSMASVNKVHNSSVSHLAPLSSKFATSRCLVDADEDRFDRPPPYPIRARKLSITSLASR
jgi:hypothetical protein